MGVQYVWLISEGDRQMDRALGATEGKALFSRAVEQALLDEQADLAVHSLKDLPAVQDPKAKTGLVIAAVPPRADVHDCLIGWDGPIKLDRLQTGATLGTASPRRSAQMRRLRPDLNVQLIRGNVQSRLANVVEHHQYDATLLAAAGLQRLGLDQYAADPLDTHTMLPAAGQGALAVQCRGDDHSTIRRCLLLNDATTAMAVHDERRVVAELGGDCHSPIAVLIETGSTEVRLKARVLSQDGRQCVEADESVPLAEADGLVDRALEGLRERGAEAVLRQK